MKTLLRLLAVLLALILLVGGLLVLAEVAWTLGLGADGELLLPYPAAADYLAGITWSDRPARAILLGVFALGLLLLWLGLRRRPPGLVLLASSTEDVPAGVERRTLHRATANAAVEVDGIAEARAAVSRRRLRVTATSGLRDSTGLRERLEAHVREWTDQLGLAQPPAPTVELREGRSR